jgi:hypothetical protein
LACWNDCSQVSPLARDRVVNPDQVCVTKNRSAACKTFGPPNTRDSNAGPKSHILPSYRQRVKINLVIRHQFATRIARVRVACTTYVERSAGNVYWLGVLQRLPAITSTKQVHSRLDHGVSFRIRKI